MDLGNGEDMAVTPSQQPLPAIPVVDDDALEALRHLFFVMERLDRQASEPNPDHFVKVTVETWRDLVSPAICAVRTRLATSSEDRR